MAITLLLRCEDLEATRHFYGQVLGFQVKDAAGNLRVDIFGGVLIFTPRDLWQAPPALTGTIYFTVPDVAAWYTSLQDRVTVAWPLQDMPYGSREFGIQDCSGYHLAFQQQHLPAGAR